MNKKILRRILIIGVVAAIGVGATIAFFSDSGESLGNVFESGGVDLKIDFDGYYNKEPDGDPDISWDEKDLEEGVDKFFDFTDIKPGDFGEGTISLHVLGNDAWGRLLIDDVLDLENGCDEAEEKAESDCALDDDGELRELVTFFAWLDQGYIPGFQNGNKEPGDSGYDTEEGDNIYQDGSEPLIIEEGTIDAEGEEHQFWPALSALYDAYGCSDVSGDTDYAECHGLAEDGHLVESAVYYLGIAWNLPSDAGNEVQTDSLEATIKFEAEQYRGNNTPFGNVLGDQRSVYMMENKNVSGDWSVIEDDTYGVLRYDPEGPTFDYEFEGFGLDTSYEHCLVYYADPWDHRGSGLNGQTGFLLSQGTPDPGGYLALSGSPDIETSLPHPDDANHPDNNPTISGAKIWLAPCSEYDEANHQFDSTWNPSNKWLFDHDEAGYRVFYERTEEPASPATETTTINTLGEDVGSQYGYNHDYSGANVSFTYDTPASGQLSGTINATGLKPYTTYQIKFSGTPTCEDSVNGDDVLNEFIGYHGRWTCVDCTGTALERNRSDAEYETNSALYGGSECIAGYLVWDFFTADASGNATKTVSTTDSYHVLWCGGGSCNSNNNTYLDYLDPSYPTQYFCPPSMVNGQTERTAIPCGGLSLDSGAYGLDISLTEESFHQGNWANVLTGWIDFEIE